MKRLFAVVLTMALLAAPAWAADEIRYSGSSIIGMAVLENGAMAAFEKKTGIRFAGYEIPGSGKGMKALIEGRATLGGASRALHTAEKKAKVLGTIIGYDAIGVYLNAANPVEDISKEQLKAILTGKLTNWSEVGGPDEPIVVITEILSAGRATVDCCIQKMVMDGADFGTGFRTIELPRDQIVEVARQPWSIATTSVGLISAVTPEQAGKVKFIKVDGIAPNAENIGSGTYLISRPLVLGTIGIPRGNVKKFIDFILTPEGQAIVGKNFVPVRL